MKIIYLFLLLSTLFAVTTAIRGQQNAQLPSIDQIFLSWDQNRDGKLKADEVPAQMWTKLAYADANGDGGVTKDELATMRRRMQNRAMNMPNQETKKTNLPSQPQVSVSSDPFKNPENWSAFEAGNIKTKGYFGVASDGRYIYYAPCRTMDFHGYALRYDTRLPFQEKESWQSYDASSTDGLETKGYAGAVYDGRYIYYVPMAVKQTRHARVLRYDTRGNFVSKSSWSAFDAGTMGGKKAMGYIGAVFDGRHIYFVPFGYKPYAHACVLRYDSSKDFKSQDSWTVYDAGNTDGLKTKGFYGAVYDGRFIYFVPFHDGSEFHGRVLCYDTQSRFQDASSWSAHDAGKTSGLITVGYKGAAFDKRYVYFVPFRNESGIHGRVLRYDTAGKFKAASSWSAFDAGSIDHLETKGYVGAEFDQRYIYFIPYSEENFAFHARFLRYDCQKNFHDTSSWSAFDAGSIDGLTTRGYKFSVYDGKYIYFAPYHNGIAFSSTVLRYKVKK